jgi:hypothetical protein
MITSTKVKLIESIDFQNSTFPELHIIADHLRNCSGPIQEGILTCIYMQFDLNIPTYVQR